MSFSNKIKQKRYEKGIMGVLGFSILKLYNVGRYLFNASYRARVISSQKNAEAHHQFSNFTFLDRYPDLFTIAKDHFVNHTHPKILSFGCSTGEEILSLANYMPRASIIGVDINDWCLKKAKQACEKSECLFYE